MADPFSRSKMQWLNKIVYDHTIDSTAVRVAYVIADFTNRATRDCWLAQRTIAKKIGKSVKTVQRSLLVLQKAGLLKISRGGPNGTRRYQPSFALSDTNARKVGHKCPVGPALRDVQSFRSNLPKSSLRTTHPEKFAEQGKYEVEIADRLGPNGFDLLAELQRTSPEALQRICRMQQQQELSDRELRSALVAISHGRGLK